MLVNVTYFDYNWNTKTVYNNVYVYYRVNDIQLFSF